MDFASTEVVLCASFFLVLDLVEVLRLSKISDVWSMGSAKLVFHTKICWSAPADANWSPVFVNATAAAACG